MLGIAGRNGHLCGLRASCDQSVVERCVFGNSVPGQDSCSGQVERQYPIGEGRQDAFVEPRAQDRSLARIGSLFRDHAPLDLGNRRRRHELVGDADRRSPNFDLRIATSDAKRRDHVGVQNVLHGLVGPRSQVEGAGGHAQALRLELDVGSLICAQ